MPNGEPKTMALNRLGELLLHICKIVKCFDVWRFTECENECKRGTYEINGNGLIWNNNRNAYAPP